MPTLRERLSGVGRPVEMVGFGAGTPRTPPQPFRLAPEMYGGEVETIPFETGAIEALNQQVEQAEARRRSREVQRQRSQTAAQELARLQEERRNIPWLGERVGIGEAITGGVAQLIAPSVPEAEARGEVPTPQASGLGRSVAELWGGEQAARNVPRSTREAVLSLFGATPSEEQAARQGRGPMQRVFTPEGMTPEEVEQAQAQARAEEEARRAELAAPQVFGETVETTSRPLRATLMTIMMGGMGGAGLTSTAAGMGRRALAGGLTAAAHTGAVLGAAALDPEAARLTPQMLALESGLGAIAGGVGGVREGVEQGSAVEALKRGVAGAWKGSWAPYTPANEPPEERPRLSEALRGIVPEDIAELAEFGLPMAHGAARGARAGRAAAREGREFLGRSLTPGSIEADYLRFQGKASEQAEPGYAPLPSMEGTALERLRQARLIREQFTPAQLESLGQRSELEGRPTSQFGLRVARESGKGMPIGGLPEDRIGPEGEPIPFTPKPEPKPQFRGIPVGKSRASGPTGTKYEFLYEVVPLDSLVASHDVEAGAAKPNPAYPKEIQPRERGRQASILQVQQIAQNLNPEELLAESPYLDRGAPIVGSDAAVESGNGRILAMRAARDGMMPGWQAYQTALRRRLVEMGVDPKSIADIPEPVLVRVRTTDVNRAAFAAEANARATLGMSASEAAAQEGARFSPEATSGIAVDSGEPLAQALLRPTNAKFLRAFLETIPANERAELLGPRGEPTLRLAERAANALFARAYPGDAGRRLLTITSETPGEGLRRLGTALRDAAPVVVAHEGAIRPELSIAEDISRAAEKLSELAARGEPVATYLNQPQMWGRELTPSQEQLLKALDMMKGSAKKMRSFIEAYYREAAKQGQAGGQFIQGEGAEGRVELLNRAWKAAQGTAEEQPSLFTEPPATPRTAMEMMEATRAPVSPEEAQPLLPRGAAAKEGGGPAVGGPFEAPKSFEGMVEQEAARFAPEMERRARTTEEAAAEQQRAFASRTDAELLALNRRLEDAARMPGLTPERSEALGTSAIAVGRELQRRGYRAVRIPGPEGAVRMDFVKVEPPPTAQEALRQMREPQEPVPPAVEPPVPTVADVEAGRRVRAGDEPPTPRPEVPPPPPPAHTPEQRSDIIARAKALVRVKLADRDFTSRSFRKGEYGFENLQFQLGRLLEAVERDPNPSASMVAALAKQLELTEGRLSGTALTARGKRRVEDARSAVTTERLTAEEALRRMREGQVPPAEAPPPHGVMTPEERRAVPPTPTPLPARPTPEPTTAQEALRQRQVPPQLPPQAPSGKAFTREGIQAEYDRVMRQYGNAMGHPEASGKVLDALRAKVVDIERRVSMMGVRLVRAPEGYNVAVQRYAEIGKNLRESRTRTGRASVEAVQAKNAADAELAQLRVMARAEKDLRKRGLLASQPTTAATAGPARYKAPDLGRPKPGTGPQTTNIEPKGSTPAERLASQNVPEPIARAAEEGDRSALPPHVTEDNGRTVAENDAARAAELDRSMPEDGSPPPAMTDALDNMRAPKRDFRWPKLPDLNLRNHMSDVAPQLTTRVSYLTKEAYLQEQRLFDRVRAAAKPLGKPQKQDVARFLNTVAVTDAADLRRVVSQPASSARTVHEHNLALAPAGVKQAFHQIRQVFLELGEQGVLKGEIAAAALREAYFPHMGHNEFWGGVIGVDPAEFRALDPSQRGQYVQDAIDRFDKLSPEVRAEWERSDSPTAPGKPATAARAEFVKDLDSLLNAPEEVGPRTDRWHTPMDEVFFRNYLKRKGGSWYKLDLDSALLSYIPGATRRNLYGPTIREWYALSKQPDWVRVPNIVRYVSNQLIQWVGAPVFPDTVLQQMQALRGALGGNWANNVSAKFRRLTSAGTLWFRPMSAAKQLLDLASLPEVLGVSPEKLAMVLKPALTDAWRAWTDPTSPQRAEALRNGINNAKSLTALQEDFQGKAWEKGQEAGFWMMRKADTTVRGLSYFIAKRIAERYGLTPELRQLHGTPENWARMVADEVAGTLVRGLSPQSQHTVLGRVLTHFWYIPGKQWGRSLRAAFGIPREQAGAGRVSRIRGDIGAPPLALGQPRWGAFTTMVARLMTYAALVYLVKSLTGSGYGRRRAAQIAFGGTPMSPMQMLTGEEELQGISPVSVSPEVQTIFNFGRWAFEQDRVKKAAAWRDVERVIPNIIPGGGALRDALNAAITIWEGDRKPSGTTLTEGKGGFIRQGRVGESWRETIARSFFLYRSQYDEDMMRQADQAREMKLDKEEVMADVRAKAQAGDVGGAVDAILAWHKEHPGGDPRQDFESLKEALKMPAGTSFGRAMETAPPEARAMPFGGEFTTPRARELWEMAQRTKRQAVRRILLEEFEREQRQGAD